ncbi:hypothetical protein JCM5296_001404 [Sporobolomyces johnsonii]
MLTTILVSLVLPLLARAVTTETGTGTDTVEHSHPTMTDHGVPYQQHPHSQLVMEGLFPANQLNNPLASPSHDHLRAPPTPPALQWLFTADLLVQPNIAPQVVGPHGIRADLPIVGGTIIGVSGLNGTILNRGGSDWVLVDPRSNVGSTDARWQIVLPPTNSTNGVNTVVFVRTSGPSLRGGGLNKAHLRIVMETGVKEWYWLNEVMAVGILTILNPGAAVQTVHIEAFNFQDDWNATTLSLA